MDLLKVNLVICETQGEIYRSAAKKGYNMPLFSYNYMNSKFCERNMDSLYSPIQYGDADLALEYFEEECQNNGFQISKNENIAFWIGYMYRYIADSLGISSSDVVKKVDYCKMLQMYEGFHTVDEDLMVEKLNETYLFVFDDSKCAEWNMEK